MILGTSDVKEAANYSWACFLISGGTHSFTQQALPWVLGIQTWIKNAWFCKKFIISWGSQTGKKILGIQHMCGWEGLSGVCTGSLGGWGWLSGKVRKAFWREVALKDESSFTSERQRQMTWSGLCWKKDNSLPVWTVPWRNSWLKVVGLLGGSRLGTVGRRDGINLR